MIEEKAIVVELSSDEIVVESIVKSGCSGCQQIKSCGSGQIAQAFPQKKTRFSVQSTIPLNLGDHVVIGLSEKILLSAAWQVYMWPLVGLIIASVLGQYLVDTQIIPNELLALPIAFLGAYLGYFLAKIKQKDISKQSEWLPVILNKCNETSF